MKDKNERLGADLLQRMFLFGGPQVGFLTNPETKNKPSFILVNDEKVVCTAQGGECRNNSNYYTPGLRDIKSWTTPIIDETCPNNCPYKMLVCDEHATGECKTTYAPYPEWNKFRGQFARYCREFSRLEKKK